MTFCVNDHFFFPPIDGSSTERGPSTTTASASASNVASWAQGPPALPLPQPQPQPTASPLPRPGDELCSALLSSPTAAEWRWRSPVSTAPHYDHKATHSSAARHPAVCTLLHPPTPLCSLPLGQNRAVRGQRRCLLYYCLKSAVLVFTVVAW